MSETKNQLESVHPLGEEEDFAFQFSPGGGRVHLSQCQDNLSAYGGLVAWHHFLERIGILDRLAQYYPLERTSPNATPVIDILRAFALNCLVGGKRFAHQSRLQNDIAIAKIIGCHKGRLCGEDAFPRLCLPLEVGQARDWMSHGEEMIYHAIPNHAIADWDSTVNTRYGKQEDVETGYNPHKPGRGSHHPLVCAIAGTRLALHMEWRKGNTVSATDWRQAMDKVWANPIARARIKLNRGDIGFGQEKVMAWHEQTDNAPRPAYLFKLKLTKGVKKAIAKINWPEWSNEATGVEQYAETSVKLHGWSCARRIVVSRTLKPVNPGAQEEFWELAEETVHVYVTNLTGEEADAAQIILLYRKRADAENVFDELKNQWGFAGFCSSKAVVSESAARLLLMIYNLWAMFVRVTQNRSGHTEAVTSRHELLMMPCKLVITGRQKHVKLAISERFKEQLQAAYQRLSEWLRATAPQLALSSYRLPEWELHEASMAPG